MSFETIIGLEIHAELNTRSKIFCSCSTEFGKNPNLNTCPVCMGIPGTLPVLNEEVVNLAVKAGALLHCEISSLSRMDRKNYFYPDLPKGYQISQYDIPMCRGGYIDVEADGINHRIRLNRIHIEEDAGKLIHLEKEGSSLVDYNRAGVPLLEIVTEPDIRSVDQAIAFLRTLKLILEYGGISDCRMEQGSLRCDANISLRETNQKTFNNRVELKNLNSFKELQKALEKEEKRQLELYISGEGKIRQETRRWDSSRGITIPMRSKEDSDDYRYFPDPDLTPIIISEEQINMIREELPEMPAERKRRFRERYGLSDKEIDIITGDKALSDYYEELVACGTNPVSSANWLLGSMLKLLNMNALEPARIPVAPHLLSQLIKLIGEGRISITAGQEVFAEMFDTGMSAENIINERGLSQISGTADLTRIITGVMDSNPQSVSDYASGKLQALGFLMGQVMKASKGKANPKVAKELLEEQLKNRTGC